MDGAHVFLCGVCGTWRVGRQRTSGPASLARDMMLEGDERRTATHACSIPRLQSCVPRAPPPFAVFFPSYH